MACGSGVIAFLVLYAIITCCLEIYLLYFLHALIVSSARKGMEIFIFCTTMLLIGINGFASLCPCYDDRDEYIDLTTFWFPLFYGFQSTMVLLVLYHKLCNQLNDAKHLKVFDRTKSIFNLMIGLVLFLVMLLTLAMGELETATLIIYIVVILFVHVITIGVFLSKLMAIYKDSGKSYDRAIPMAASVTGTANAASPRQTGGGGHGDFVESGSPDADKDGTAALVPVSTVSLLAAPVTLLIRSATILTASLCVHCAFVIWFAAVYEEEDGDEYPVIATLMYYASSLDVFLHFMAVMRLHEAMDKEVHFCVRGVPHSFIHPLQHVADAEQREKEREAAQVEAQAMGFHVTNSTRDVILGYEDKGNGDGNAPQLDNDGDVENLDKYELQTIEDHASYHREEEQLNQLMEEEIGKTSASPDTVYAADEEHAM